MKRIHEIKILEREFKICPANGDAMEAKKRGKAYGIYQGKSLITI